jgi:uncharacterized protein YbcI
MIAKAGHQDLQTELAQALQAFWHEYAGIRPGRVRVVSDEEAIVVWLEEVLSPAEQQLAGTQEGRKMLQELEERILEQARPELQSLVERAAGQKSTQAEVHLDVQNGSVLGFFQLG